MHKKVNIIIYLIIALLLIYLITMNLIDHFKIKEYEHYMDYLDTEISIKIYSRSIDEKIFDEIENIYKEYDMLTSNKESNVHNLYYLNNSEEDIIEVEPKLYELIKIGLDYYNKSEGLININMGCIYDLYNNYIVGDDISCDTNINNIELLGENKIKKNNFNINLDNIKVSYVNDIVSNLLKEKGYKNYIIDVTSNKIVGEKDFNSKPFSIGIQYDENSIIGTINLKNKSIVSKGSFNGFKDIIHPKTLLPMNNYLNVSVISDSDMLSSFLVNVLYFKSIEEGEEFLKNYEAEAIWVLKDKTVKYTNNLDYKTI